MSQTILALTKQIKTIVGEIDVRRRLNKAARIEAGKLLIQLRDQFANKNEQGTVLRGPKGGTFCAHLIANGLNIGVCYQYIGLAEGKPQHSPVRVQYWQTLNLRMKKASAKGRVALLKSAVSHLVKLYGIKVVVSYEEK